MHFSGKRPLGDTVIAAMAAPPGIRGRQDAINRVLTGVDHILELFDGGIGELEQT